MILFKLIFIMLNKLFKPFKLLISLLLILSINACFFSETEQKKESITKGWSPKTFFNQAKDKATSGSSKEAIALFEQLQGAYPGSKYSVQAKLEIAYILYKTQEYDRAIKQLNNYIKLYPQHDSTAYAYYLRGVISEDKSKSFLDDYVTDSAQRDIKSVRNALNYYFALIDKFPNSEYAKEAKNRLVTLRNSLARHELFVAIYYTKKTANIAAINRAKFIIEQYPNTPSVPAALHLMAHNYDIIKADKLAADTRRVLQTSYPQYIVHYSLED